MSQTDAGWGAGPSGRYESLAERFRPVFAEIRATAVERDRERRLPHAEIGWLREANFTTLRLAPDAGGHGASLPELFALLIELSAADSNVTNALRAHFGFTEDALCSSSPEWRAAWIARIGAGETIGSGVSAVKVGAGLDRYWRNARTITSHNPRLYRDRSVGAFAISGEAPPRQYRVGSA